MKPSIRRVCCCNHGRFPGYVARSKSRRSFDRRSMCDDPHQSCSHSPMVGCIVVPILEGGSNATPSPRPLVFTLRLVLAADTRPHGKTTNPSAITSGVVCVRDGRRLLIRTLLLLRDGPDERRGSASEGPSALRGRQTVGTSFSSRILLRMGLENTIDLFGAVFLLFLLCRAAVHPDGSDYRTRRCG